MTVLLVDRPPTDSPSLFDADALARREAAPGPTRAARLTLEALVSGVWEGLVVRGSAACPVCAGRMTGSEAAGGRCGDCGATLR